MGSWVAVEPNGMGLPSRVDPPGLGAVLPLQSKAQPFMAGMKVYKLLFLIHCDDI